MPLTLIKTLYGYNRDRKSFCVSFILPLRSKLPATYDNEITIKKTPRYFMSPDRRISKGVQRVLRRECDINLHSSILQTGIYVRCLSHWLHYFDRNNPHIGRGEELIPLGVLEIVQDVIRLLKKYMGT
ncbi:hypothetical protein MAR_028942 [Mya arenaria]|uniref:Uncharacterized protein n=1 Tax=Mya arenaria TaxID=6604 RepID=A0ABY7DF27_MYAAR|nr:hypothetical protein MAR_028942 [Mya arenaria]